MNLQIRVETFEQTGERARKMDGRAPEPGTLPDL